MNRKLLRLLMATGLLTAVSCSDHDDWTGGPATAGDEEVTVTLTVSADSGTGRTRADDPDDTDAKEESQMHISDGTKATRLIYAVYTPQDDSEEPYYLLEQYGNGDLNAGKGQAVIDNAHLLKEDGGEQITLRLLRGREYYIAFWAQDPACTAYTTTDLEHVVVNYTGANNDELRDAYSATISFTAQQGIEVSALLTRAMAQVNVGTAGWDYIDEVGYGNRYAYSKFVVKGAYDQLDVLSGEVSQTDAFKEKPEIDYGWNRLPAYIHLEDELNAALPTETTNSDDVTTVTEADMKTLASFLTTPKAEQTNEEFLFVKLTPTVEGEASSDLYEEGYIKGHYYLKYLEQTPAALDGTEGTKIEGINGIYTEVFKYLSMCYVLAPNDADDDASKVDPTFGGTVVDVEFYLSESPDGCNYIEPEASGEGEQATPSEGSGTDSEDAATQVLTKTKVTSPIFSIVNVPVQRNWRTNILGGTGREADEEESSSIFNPREVKLYVQIAPGYDGEHNNDKGGAEDAWTTWTPSSSSGTGADGE